MLEVVRLADKFSHFGDQRLQLCKDDYVLAIRLEMQFSGSPLIHSESFQLGLHSLSANVPAGLAFAAQLESDFA